MSIQSRRNPTIAPRLITSSSPTRPFFGPCESGHCSKTGSRNAACSTRDTWVKRYSSTETSSIDPTVRQLPLKNFAGVLSYFFAGLLLLIPSLIIKKTLSKSDRLKKVFNYFLVIFTLQTLVNQRLSLIWWPHSCLRTQKNFSPAKLHIFPLLYFAWTNQNRIFLDSACLGSAKLPSESKFQVLTDFYFVLYR